MIKLKVQKIHEAIQTRNSTDQSSAQSLTEGVPVVGRPATFNKQAEAHPETENEVERNQDQNYFVRHIRVMVNTGRDWMKR